MNYLTLAIPAYQAEFTMGTCLDSLIAAGIEGLEVLVVNDGSNPQISQTVEGYVAKYPDHIRLLNKEYGGLGSALNLALREATCPWFRILDGDDRLDPQGLAKLMEVLRDLEEENPKPELVVADYYYEIPRKGGTKYLERASFANVFPEVGINSWSRLKNFAIDQILGKQSLVYRLDLLRKIKLRLPDQLAYVDEIFSYEPLPHVRRIYYLDEPVYIFPVGRPNQASNMKVMERHLKDLLAVALEMFRRVRLDSVRPQRLQQYMYRHMARVIAVCLMLSCDEEQGNVASLKTMDLIWSEFAKINAPAAHALQKKPMLNSKRILKAAKSYVEQDVYNLIDKVFIID